MKETRVTIRAPHPNAFFQVPVGTEVTVHWPNLTENEMKPSIELPTPALFTHQLLTTNRQGEVVPNGIHIGVNDRHVCEQGHTEGETHNEIHEWYTAEQMLSFAAELLEAHKRKQNE